MKAANKSKTPGKPKPSRRSIAKSIARMAEEFMAKPGERGVDAVGELIKSRRSA